jgi:riboflavin transporter FmnP
MSEQSRYRRTGPFGWLNVLKWEGMREIDRQNEKRVNILAFLWALCLIGAALLVAWPGLPDWLGWALAIVPAFFGVLTMRAYLKLLREMDELLRHMQFEAMAVGFGTGLILGNTLVIIDGFPRSFIAPAIVAPMAIAYCIRIVLGARELARQPVEGDDE